MGSFARRQLGRWLPVAAYGAAISLLSHRSRISLPAGGPDFAWHAAEFAVLGFLLVRALHGGLRGRVSWPRRVAAGLLAMLFGALDEWHQAFVPGRVASGMDVLADGLGGVLGVAGSSLLSRWRCPREGPDLVLITRAGCDRCREVLASLRRLREELPFRLRVRDVDAWPRWREAYRESVPVLLLDGETVAREDLDVARLARLIRDRTRPRARGGVDDGEEAGSLSR